MNVCVICQGDGVLLTAGNWYCVNHVGDAFIATAAIIARIQGSDEEEAKAKAEEWLDEL